MIGGIGRKQRGHAKTSDPGEGAAALGVADAVLEGGHRRPRGSTAGPDTSVSASGRIPAVGPTPAGRSRRRTAGRRPRAGRRRGPSALCRALTASSEPRGSPRTPAPVRSAASRGRSSGGRRPPAVARAAAASGRRPRVRTVSAGRPCCRTGERGAGGRSNSVSITACRQLRRSGFRSSANPGAENVGDMTAPPGGSRDPQVDGRERDRDAEYRNEHAKSSKSRPRVSGRGRMAGPGPVRRDADGRKPRRHGTGHRPGPGLDLAAAGREAPPVCW